MGVDRESLDTVELTPLVQVISTISYLEKLFPLISVSSPYSLSSEFSGCELRSRERPSLLGSLLMVDYFCSVFKGFPSLRPELRLGSPWV